MTLPITGRCARVNISGKTYADSGVIWQFHTQKAPPVPFFKLSPSTGSIDVPTNPTLEWSPSAGATAYYYCYDTSGDNTCAGSWTSNGTDTSVALAGLSYATTYYWQVYSMNAQGQVQSDSSAWWSFTTISAAPAAFNKINPTNSSSNQSLTPKLYWWSPELANGETSFSYCINTAASCPVDGWVSIAIQDLNNPIAISPALAYNTTYYWQLKALNDGGTTYADGVTGWWSFTTQKTGPTSTDQTFSVAEDGILEATLSATSNYTKTFTLVGGLPAGQFHLNSDGSFTYSPNANFNGQATFQFLVSDGYNTPAGPYTATITVTSVEDQPVINSIPTQVVNAGDLLVFLATATDGDTPYGDTLAFSLTAPKSLPDGVQISADGVFTWAVPDTMASGVYTFTITVTDSTGRSASTDVDGVVNPGIPVTGGLTIFLPLIVH